MCARVLPDWLVSQPDAVQRPGRRLPPRLRPRGRRARRWCCCTAGRAGAPTTATSSRCCSPHADVVVPDLRGFGESDRHDRPPTEAYPPTAQAASVLGLIEELGLDRPVLVGYDVGSRVAPHDRDDAARTRSARSCSPRRCPAPASGSCTAEASSGTSRSTGCRSPSAMIDGNAGGGPHLPAATSGSTGARPAGRSRPTASTRSSRSTPARRVPRSIAWYRVGLGRRADRADRSARPRTASRAHDVLWPEHDPLFPPSWSDRLGEFFADSELVMLAGVGHFSPLEAPAAIAEATVRALRR